MEEESCAQRLTVTPYRLLMSRSSAQAMRSSLLDKPILLLSIITVTYSQQIYSLRLSRPSHPFLLPPPVP